MSVPVNDAWRDCRVLVTGSRGFLGSALCARLEEAGADVWRLRRSGESSAAVPQELRCDLASFEECRAALTEIAPDRILHLAGHPFGARDLDRVIPTFRDNLATTVHVLTVAAELGVGRIVLAGSLEEPEPDSDAVPTSPYAASKWAASIYAATFRRLYGLPIVTARIFMVYGPGQADPTKLVPGTCAALLRGEAPRVGSGEREVDWVFIDDVVTGLAQLGAREGLDGQTVDLGTGRLASVREVVEQLAALVPEAPPPRFGAVPDRPHERVRAADAEATRRALGWAPATALSDGLAATLAWFRARPDLA